MIKKGAAAVVAAVVVLVGVVAPTAATAQGDDTDAAQQLADRYAPIMMLKAQDGECDTDGEQYAPTAVDIVLDNPQVLLRQVGSGNPVMTNAPSASELFDLGEGFYLDYPGDALAPGCVYETDFRRYSGDRPAVVYAHIVGQADAPDQLALQYWFFWYYNDWNNKHEGDWEGIQLLFDVGTVAEALTTDPVSVGYAQHEGGERANWDDDKLERDGTRPVVYPSVGSHASYYGSALYLGRRGTEGFGCDSTDGPSRTVLPDVVVLPDSVDDPEDPLAWVDFEGRWGERQSGAFSGPTGPITKERWLRPVDWHDELRPSSVVVPAGDDTGTAIVNSFCSVVEFGSGTLIALKANPVALLVVIVVLFSLVGWLAGRTDWSAVEPLPIVRRRRFGQIVKAAARLYRSRPGTFIGIGLIYLPVAVLAGAVTRALQQIPLFGTLIESDDGLGPVGVFTALVVGGAGHTVAFTIVRAVVATELQDVDVGADPGAVAAYHRTLRRLGDLLVAVLRAIVIVGLLLISVVGIPWGIRQLVRYQFIAEATMLDDRGRKAALDRSTELVRGRWWNTAGFFVMLNVIVLLSSSVVGLLLLIVSAGLPLWLFSVLVTTIAALIVPYSAAAATLYYGDARAQLEDRPAAEPVGVGPTPAATTTNA